jgi:hypothetical protein
VKPCAHNYLDDEAVEDNRFNDGCHDQSGEESEYNTKCNP